MVGAINAHDNRALGVDDGDPSRSREQVETCCKLVLAAILV